MPHAEAWGGLLDATLVQVFLDVSFGGKDQSWEEFAMQVAVHRAVRVHHEMWTAASQVLEQNDVKAVETLGKVKASWCVDVQV